MMAPTPARPAQRFIRSANTDADNIMPLMVAAAMPAIAGQDYSGR
jgi:hypothetical protein